MIACAGRASLGTVQWLTEKRSLCRNTLGSISRRCCGVWFADGLLALVAQPASVLAIVQELTLVKVPANTRIINVGEDRSDRVEARTKERDNEGKLSFQLKDRDWPSGKYILNIWEPAGAPVVELITLEEVRTRSICRRYSAIPNATVAEFAAGLAVAACCTLSLWLNQGRSEILVTAIDFLAGLLVVIARKLDIPKALFYRLFFAYWVLNGVFGSCGAWCATIR